MKTIRDIFASADAPEHDEKSNDNYEDSLRAGTPDVGSANDDENTDGKIKMFCPACYMNYYSDSSLCPECGTPMEEAMTEDEEDELFEMLMHTRS